MEFPSSREARGKRKRRRSGTRFPLREACLPLASPRTTPASRFRRALSSKQQHASLEAAQEAARRVVRPAI